MESDVADDLLNRLVTWFEDADEETRDQRNLAERCRDYYDGEQWTDAEKEKMRDMGQMPIVINRIRRKIDWLRGLEAQSRTDPRAFPRTPQHDQGAKAATDALRFVADNEDMDRKRSFAWDQMLVEGIGAIEVVHHFVPPMNQPEIVLNAYHYNRVFYDPHSREADFSDARYLGAVIWGDAAQIKRQYPDKGEIIDSSVAQGAAMDDKLEDIPAHKRWADRDRKRVRVVLMHYIEDGKWRWAKYVKDGILAEGESPYVDEEGESVCPLLLQSAYVGRDGNRYGVVKDMLDPQDEINKHRSKILHFISSRQTVSVKGAVEPKELARQLSKPNGNVEIDPDAIEASLRELGVKPFEVLQTADQLSGQIMLLQESKSEIDLMGANSGLQGKSEGDQSGRAIMARQQGGLIEIAPLTDGLSDFTRRIYRHIWMRVRQFWTDEKWIRVTDDERNVRFVGLNQPVTLRQHLSQLPEGQMIEQARRLGLRPGDPRLDEVIRVENPVEEIDVDIIIEEAPDTVTLEAETFEQVVNIATSMPGSVPPQVLIELAPGIDRDVKERILQHIEQQSQMQAQQGQQAQAVQMQTAQIDAQEKQASSAQKMADAAKKNVEAQRLALGY